MSQYASRHFPVRQKLTKPRLFKKAFHDFVVSGTREFYAAEISTLVSRRRRCIGFLVVIPIEKLSFKGSCSIPKRLLQNGHYFCTTLIIKIKKNKNLSGIWKENFRPEKCKILCLCNRGLRLSLIRLHKTLNSGETFGEFYTDFAVLGRSTIMTNIDLTRFLIDMGDYHSATPHCN